jgi:hypothetical protein
MAFWLQVVCLKWFGTVLGGLYGWKLQIPSSSSKNFKFQTPIIMENSSLNGTGLKILVLGFDLVGFGWIFGRGVGLDHRVRRFKGPDLHCL